MRKFKKISLLSLGFVSAMSIATIVSCSNNTQQDEANKEKETNFIYENLESKKLTIKANKEIKEREFHGKNIKELVLEEGIKKIPEKAFMNNNIEKLVIPNSVEEIGDYAFEFNNIKELEIDVEKSNLKKIGTLSFGRLDIEELIFPKNLEEISNDSFMRAKIKYLDFSKSKITKIPNRSFFNGELEELILSDKIEEIGDVAFTYNNIEELDLKKVKKIGRSAFYGNKISNLYNHLSEDKIKIIENIESIGDSAFGENQLNKLTINGVKEIGASAFSRNIAEEIQIDFTGLVSIGSEAFNNQKIKSPINLKIENPDKANIEGKLYKPFGWGKEIKDYDNSIKSIKDKIYSVEDIFIINSETKKLDGFHKDLDLKDYFKNTSNLSRYADKVIDLTAISGMVDGIADNAFEGKEIQEIIFCSCIKSIGKKAFKDNKIDYLFIPNSIESINEEAFVGNLIKFLDLRRYSDTDNDLAIEKNAFSNSENVETIYVSKKYFEVIKNDDKKNEFIKYYQGLLNITIEEAKKLEIQAA